MTLICTKSFHSHLYTVYVVFIQDVCGVLGIPLGRGACVGILCLFS